MSSKIVYYKGKRFTLIGELDSSLSRIASENGIEKRVVPSNLLKSEEEYKEYLEKKAFRSHQMWIR